MFQLSKGTLLPAFCILTIFPGLTFFQYEDCIKDCDKAVERGRELRADYKMVARALTRKGTALVKMAKCSADFDPAIETFQKALTEHRNPDTLKKLNEAQKAKKDLEQKEYFDPKLADEEREKGIVFFSVISPGSLFPASITFIFEVLHLLCILSILFFIHIN